MSNSINGQIANAIFDLLVSECGSSESLRDQFVAYLSKDIPNHEFRIGGKLGYGGKFYNCNGDWSVGYYAEDHTDEVMACKTQIYNALQTLKEDLMT